MICTDLEQTGLLDRETKMHQPATALCYPADDTYLLSKSLGHVIRLQFLFDGYPNILDSGEIAMSVR